MNDAANHNVSNDQPVLRPAPTAIHRKTLGPVHVVYTDSGIGNHDRLLFE